jgi:hypothetical protein
VARAGENSKFMRNYKKNNAWNIGRLVNESFVPANQRTTVLYCRLSDFVDCRTFETASAFSRELPYKEKEGKEFTKREK